MQEGFPVIRVVQGVALLLKETASQRAGLIGWMSLDERQQAERTWKDSADFLPLVKDCLDWWDPDSTVIGSTSRKVCAGRVLAYCSGRGKCQSRTSSAGTARRTKDHLRIRHRLLGPFDNVSLEHMIQASARPGHR